MSRWQRLRDAARRWRADRRTRRRALAAEQVTAQITTEVYGRLHRAAANLADLASEVHAYADLLEEKTGELEARHKKAPPPKLPTP
ncbi:hypothetical protein [Bailinhaonella thermotolerans]|uniref:Uncharacterized protein n=1 Tax=Bailinhaonella thermotolerans TaxID=1070861 RepID=A0A3A4AYT9_9ACTN|nr:hypothetical protein [Bailinhaonella thermotolerans]RJL33549.1 hypothetical protein D5H75_12355 [Bailinhaonella thermotolerans]